MHDGSSENPHDTKGHLCLFAHYDANGCVADHVVFYLQRIREAEFDIVFVSTAKLNDKERAKVSPLTIDIIVRENVGLDFGSWMEAYKKYRPGAGSLMLLCNDSAYGPLWDLSTTIRLLRGVDADFYGMVRSNEIEPHIQSWFLLLTPTAHQDAAFNRFMRTQVAGLSKRQIIENLEVGLTKVLEAEGLTSHALYDPRRHRAKLKIAGNPTHMLWRQLITVYKVPFIKIELLRDNPERVRLSGWQHLVGRFNIDLMRQMGQHLTGAKKTVGFAWAARSQHAFCVLDAFLARNGFVGVQALNFGLWKLARGIALLGKKKTVHVPPSSPSSTR